MLAKPNVVLVKHEIAVITRHLLPNRVTVKYLLRFTFIIFEWLLQIYLRAFNFYLVLI